MKHPLVREKQVEAPKATDVLPEEIPADFDYSNVDWDKVVPESEILYVTVEDEETEPGPSEDDMVSDLRNTVTE